MAAVRGSQKGMARLLACNWQVGAEMLGTFIMIFSVYGVISSTVMTQGRIGLMEYAATAGFCVVLLVFAIGPISGAHVNPSITIGFAASGQFPWSQVPAYVVAQTGGAILAAYVGQKVYEIQGEFAVTQPLQGRKAAFWTEFMATFFIMFLASSLSTNAHLVGQLSGVAAGASIALAVMITAPISGGSMNPARSLGPAIISNRYGDIWLYVLAPTIGAVAGAFTYRLLHLPHPPCPPNEPSRVSSGCGEA
ncbi:probable aquaporin NIP7-1 isoform X2 [Nymphaea colorata]|uniref:probable aquaporin NIP7-1 isoform X2 n=1 Tax=Nymphaea colorata TaxID=210225 RepID=UPI00214E9F5F|nr:probable aquaporin NIP7-1 isoform X2 [Nymphaea colorata]